MEVAPGMGKPSECRGNNKDDYGDSGENALKRGREGVRESEWRRR